MRKLFSLIAAVLFAGSMMADVTDVLTNDIVGVSGTSYADWSGVKVTSDAVYAGQSAATDNTIQLRSKNSNSGVITTATGGTIKSVEVTFNTKTVAERVLNLYASNTAFASPTDLYAAELEPVASFTCSEGATQKFEFTEEFAFFGVRSADGALYLDNITAVWDGEGGDDPAEPVVVYDWAGKIGATVLGTTGVEETTVKIHTNTDAVNAIKFGSSYVYAEGKWIAIKPAEGGFKAGDVLSVAVVFNNADDTKYAQIDLRAANGDTRIWLSDSASTINGRTSAAEPIVQTYRLESDQDSLFLGRYGNTGMFITLLNVVRGGEAPVEELTFDFKLENNILTITPSNNDPWAGMALPTAVITEDFGTIEALVDAVKDMQGTTTGKQSLDLTKLDPEEFPAGTECTFVAYGLVEGAVTTIASFEFVVPEPLADPTNCAEAAEAALSVEKNGDLYNGGKEYTIEGYVTEIATAWSSQYSNISFWMADEKDGGQVLEAFRAACAAEADAPAVGDKVKVTGKLTKYNTTPEFAAGCTFVITEKAEPVDENEVVKLGFNLPTENRPADNSIEIAGSFVEGTMALEKIEATGWFLSYDFVKAVADDTFKLRDKSNNDLILCKYNEGKAIWEQAIFTFGDYWQDDTWKGTPCKLIEEDLSNAAEYAWKEGAPEPSEELVDPTNCAEAAEAALSVSENNELYNDGKEYTIEGYVTEIQTAWSSQYNNISFWMADEKDGGKVLEAYRAACASAEDAVRVGDKVKVTGALTKYNTTPEFAAGCTYEIIERGEQPDPKNLGEKTIAEFLALKNTVDTCILTGAIDSLVNASYGNFNLVDETGKVYIYGLKDAEGNYCYEAKGLAEGDIITVLAIYSEYYGKPQVKNAIFVSKKSQGIDNTSVEIKVEKFFRDGQLIIRKNGIEYNVQGAVIK